MTRHTDWPSILPKAIWAWNGKLHEFGASDCVVMFRAVCLKIGAADPLPAGITWTTPIGAARAIAKVGGIPAQLARVYPEIAPSQALSGDALAVDKCDAAPLGAVWMVASGRAWTMVEGDALWAGGLVAEDVSILIDRFGDGLRAFHTGRAI